MTSQRESASTSAYHVKFTVANVLRNHTKVKVTNTNNARYRYGHVRYRYGHVRTCILRSKRHAAVTDVIYKYLSGNKSSNFYGKLFLCLVFLREWQKPASKKVFTLSQCISQLCVLEEMLQIMHQFRSVRAMCKKICYVYSFK